MKRVSRLADDLFSPVVESEKQHRGFQYAAASETMRSARRTLNETYALTTEWDAHFVQQFQINFDARVWELYLYRYFREAGLNVRVNVGTDFALHHRGAEIYVEAVTANPAGGGVLVPSTDVRAIRLPTGLPEVRKCLGEEVPIRLAQALSNKLAERYWERSVVRDSPLVFAIQDFHSNISLGFIDAGLLSYLYGAEIPDMPGSPIFSRTKARHVLGSKTVPSGFFFQEGAENVSAVMFSNAGTIAKFNRMGHQENPLHGIVMVRQCVLSEAGYPRPVAWCVGQGRREGWGDELIVFHNPRAVHPLPQSLFADLAHHWDDRGHICSSFPPDFISMSQTLVIEGRTKSDKGALSA